MSVVQLSIWGLSIMLLGTNKALNVKLRAFFICVTQFLSQFNSLISPKTQKYYCEVKLT